MQKTLILNYILTKVTPFFLTLQSQKNKANMAMRFLPALLIPFLGLAYVLWHIWNVLPLSNMWRYTIVILFALIFFAIFIVVSPLIDRLPTFWASLSYKLGGSAPFVLLYTFMAFLLLDIARLLHLIPKSVIYGNAYTSIALIVILIGVFTYGYIHYYNKSRQTLELTTKKPLNKEIKMILISDLHIGYLNSRKDLASWVDMINKENPDVILIAGDIIDRNIKPLKDENMALEFKRINAPMYACLGNHEYYSGILEAEEFYRQANINLLRDSVARFEAINIIGRDDRVNTKRKPLSELVKNLDLNRYTIVITHQPFNLEEAEQAKVDFQLSGHTHHGQVFPISLITQAVYENAYGESSRGNTRYYVTSGLGIWGGKYRIGTCSEYVVATLKNSN